MTSKHWSGEGGYQRRCVRRKWPFVTEEYKCSPVLIGAVARAINRRLNALTIRRAVALQFVVVVAFVAVLSLFLLAFFLRLEGSRVGETKRRR